MISQFAQIGVDPRAFVFSSLVLFLLVCGALVGTSIIVMSRRTVARRVALLLAGIIMLLITMAVLQALWHSGAFLPKETVTWDFTKSRASAIVGWPTDKTGSGRDWWSPSTRRYAQVTIILPDRPRLISVNPTNVLFDRKADQIIRISINEEPVTQERALARLRALAEDWAWPWDGPAYARWVKRTNENDTSSISAGDRWNSGKVPYVSASILHSAATPDRPWYIQLHVEWPEALPAPRVERGRSPPSPTSASPTPPPATGPSPATPPPP